MLFNLYGNVLEKVSLSAIEKTLAKFNCTKEECLTAFFAIQANAGKTVFKDDSDWSHEVIYFGF